MNGCVTDVKVYNNTFYYNIADKSTHPVEANNWGGTFPNGVELKNNIWHMPSGSVSWVNVGMITNLTMDSNVYSGNVSVRAEDVNAITDAPVFANQGGTSAQDYKLVYGSILAGRGVEITDHGGQDYFGNTLEPGVAPTPGAHEIQSDSDVTPPDPDVIITGINVLRNAKSLDFALTQSGTNAAKSSYTGTDSQKWQFNHLGDGLYNIINVSSGHFLRQSTTGSGANVDLYPTEQIWKSLQWKLILLADGNYKVVGVRDLASSEFALRGAGSEAGNVDVYTSNNWLSEQWTITAP
ncbi:MAG: RICIN domain-containing protein [Alteromonadaceae bacterium]|nr:RICIN domain-containing protein [Alteromonadaceae bacterium]